jgi:hypothetical protein
VSSESDKPDKAPQNHDSKREAVPDEEFPPVDAKNSRTYVLAEMSPAEIHAVFERIRLGESGYLELTRRAWESGGNPFHVWAAIHACTEIGYHLPKWGLDYLAQVSKRMMARDALPKKDLRDALPKIVGFAIKPGANLLNPSRYDAHILTFMFLAKDFAGLIEDGAEPTTALDRARTRQDTAIADKDDRTLLKYISKVLGVTGEPRTRADWMAAIEAWRKQATEAREAQLMEEMRSAELWESEDK